VAGEAGIVSMFKVEAGKILKIGDGHFGPIANVVLADDATHRSIPPVGNLDGQASVRFFRTLGRPLVERKVVP
jgi:hypothetical protein